MPWLLLEHQVSACTGYRWATLAKMIDCGVFNVVRPAGCGQRRFQKVQIAQLIGIDVSAGLEAFRSEPQLMSAKSVCRWTGYGRRTLESIAEAGGLPRVRPAGLTNGRYHKKDVAKLLGFT